MTSTCAVGRRGLGAWLARGALGAVLVTVAAVSGQPVVAIPALLGALVAFRGCPMCWTAGLLERLIGEGASATRQDQP